jgi:hypothetical protein
MHPAEQFPVSLNRSLLAACVLGFSLAGCGGGGGGGQAPQVTVSIGDPVGLGSSPINRLAFPILLSGPASGDLTLSYSTANAGTATGGTSCGSIPAPDYVTVSNGRLVIPSGQSSGTIEITVCDPSAFVAAAGVKVDLTNVSANGRFATDAPRFAYGLVNVTTPGKLNDTGVAQCGNWTPKQVDCPQIGFSGQDAEYGRDASSLSNADADGRKGFAFSKLAVNAGKALVLSGSSLTWECVQDNVTGLMWEAKTDTNKAANLKYDDAEAHRDTVNGAKLCGYDNWRLPTPQELAGLVDSSVGWSATPTIPQGDSVNNIPDFFPNQQKANYWTATSDASAATEAWSVDFRSGIVSPYAKNKDDAGVLLVRGGSAAPSYQPPVSETVTDSTTGLTWRLCVDGLSGADCASGAATGYDWQAALTRVAALNQTGFAGHKDWRLPNRKELQSIVNYAAHNPAINTAFPGFPSAGGNALSCWTSTPYALDEVAAKAWFVDFISGDVGIAALTNTKALLLVRGGK